MDDFDTFKANREKMDPSSRKFSDRQWQKAYAAYRRSRERVNETKSPARPDDASKGRRSADQSRASYSGSGHSPLGALRKEVRQNSAYGDLRLVVDVLAWVAIGLFVLTGAVRLVYYTNTNAALVALLVASSQVIGVIFLRLLVHVIVDIPDIALHDRIYPKTNRPKEDARGQ